MKAPAIIYADLKCLLEKMSICHNNPEKSYIETRMLRRNNRKIYYFLSTN